MKSTLSSQLESPLRQHEIAALSCFEGVSDALFDELIGLAASYFSVPIALISVLEASRQWFLAQSGMACDQTPLLDSFCATAVEANGFFEVGDALADSRFRDNPLVVGSPGIRFYAGWPLVTEDGVILGMFCIIDTVPRPPLSDAQRDTLRRLAALVMLRIRDLRSSNYIDATIGLFNRIKFEKDVEVYKGRDEAVTVIAADMVSPAFLNEIVKSLGYPFSAEVMKVLKERLQGVIGSRSLYKISPTRFGFLLAEGEDTAAIIERLAREIELPIECAGIPLQPRTGLGVLALHGRAWNDDWLRCLVSTADHARRNGKGWFHFEPALDHAQVRAFTLLTSLSKAVRAEEEFYLEYQPRVEVATGRMCAVEALLRWRHPELGFVGPGEFIPLAEKTPLIRQISSWVARRALDQLAAWSAAGHDWCVSLNVSAADMADSEFVDELILLLQEKGIRPQQLELEFTESALMTNPELTKRNLHRIREFGIELAIDDFGTGYSNWTYLRDLPATTVKLDQSFMRDVQTNPRDRAVVESIIDLAQSVGYTVVAEGVESAPLYALLAELGCNQIQGYFVARPMPGQLIPQWVASRPA